MAEKIGSMPCDNPQCNSAMDVMQDKRKKFYTVCECGRNTRNTNKGQELFTLSWEQFQSGGLSFPSDEGFPQSEEPLQDSPESEDLLQEEIEKPKSKKAVLLILLGLMVGGGAWLATKQTR